MIKSLEQILTHKRFMHLSEEDMNWWYSNYDEILPIAEAVLRKIPSIGFISVSGRMNAFLSTCRHIDTYVSSDEINIDQAQMIILLLRISHKPFEKAATMFDHRAIRFDDKARVEIGQTARTYLAYLEMYG